MCTQCAVVTIMLVDEQYNQYTVVSQVNAHGRLNITRNFGPHGCLPGIKIQDRSCYSGPLKCGIWVLTQEWALAQDTTVLYNLSLLFQEVHVLQHHLTNLLLNMITTGRKRESLL